MEEPLSKKIDRLLREGKEKRQILRSEKTAGNEAQLVFLLNDLPSLKNRQTFLLPNLVLAAVLTIMTALKILAAISIGVINLYFFLSLVVPMINIYVLKKILRFRRTGYLYLLVLSFLALFQPENHHAREIIILGIMLFLSGLLYLKMFPRQDLITPAARGDNGQ